jgi:hypothetical protein
MRPETDCEKHLTNDAVWSGRPEPLDLGIGGGLELSTAISGASFKNMDMLSPASLELNVGWVRVLEAGQTSVQVTGFVLAFEITYH